MAEAYPLSWPEGWERTAAHERKTHSAFKTTFDKARRDLMAELGRLGATNVVVSSWLPLRRDGQPYADQARRRMEDPGVAVYFTLRGRQMVMARDAFTSVHDNLRSIGLGIEHLRGLERHGGGTMMERAFTGFAALSDRSHWRTVLNFPAAPFVPVLEQLTARYRALAKEAHADAGGSDEKMAELNIARDQAMKECGYA